MVEKYLRHSYTRKQFFDLIWSIPLYKLSQELGISQIEIRKICIKQNIPRPTAAHWAKLNLGKQSKIPELPTVDNEENITFTATNPAYTPLTQEQLDELVRQKVLEKAIAHREKERKKYVNSLLDRIMRIERAAKLVTSYKSQLNLDNYEHLRRMIEWFESWIEQQKNELSAGSLNSDETIIELFKAGDPDFHFDPEAMEADFFHWEDLMSLYDKLDR